MKIAIVGSTGGTGIQLVKQALEAGHSVTAVARRPEALGIQHPNLKIAKGDVLEVASLRAAFEGQEVVLSGLGARTLAFRKYTMLSEGCRNMLEAISTTGTRRIIVITSAGLERVDPGFPGFYKWILRPVLLQRFYDDHARVEEMLRKSAVEWISVRPYYLNDGPKLGAARASAHLLPPKPQMVSRADVAAFMLQQLTAKTWLGKTPALAG
jgi:putative NADH-flavin reductase